MSDQSAASAPPTAAPSIPPLSRHLELSVRDTGVLDPLVRRHKVESGRILGGSVLISDQSAASAPPTAAPSIPPLSSHLELSVHGTGVLDQLARRRKVESGSILDGSVLISNQSAASAPPTAAPYIPPLSSHLELSVHGTGVL